MDFEIFWHNLDRNKLRNENFMINLQNKQHLPNACLNMVVNFALSQSLIETLAKGEIVLLLGALNELFDLPGAGTLRCLVLILVVSLSGRLLLWCRLATSASTEHTSYSTTSHVTL